MDEIYNEVDHVEPWMSGNARGPSTAFCLLYRLFTMELDDRNVNHLIRHRDSPYIRALGFLYVRYVRDPKEFGRWFDPFFKDDEEFAPWPTAASRSEDPDDLVQSLMRENVVAAAAAAAARAEAERTRQTPRARRAPAARARRRPMAPIAPGPSGVKKEEGLGSVDEDDEEEVEEEEEVVAADPPEFERART